ncbi:hypothetical protein K461DRAFT_33807 [Myriangium duriaei CBS 260.36]|uniref:Uncharacterized protein n=1 Tax=Myriangium duriaei CBS 260.36 TaxID=1168546 RepID=A0A9P4IZS2_9PEZI|nr:hypothetical protein K461DRAFT_33807 [Myriangium duriaei CBS 260.36]
MNHACYNPDPKVVYLGVCVNVKGAKPEAVLRYIDASAKALVFHAANSKGRPIEWFSVGNLAAKASAGISGVVGSHGFPTYVGADARVNLVYMKLIDIPFLKKESSCRLALIFVTCLRDDMVIYLTT